MIIPSRLVAGTISLLCLLQTGCGRDEIRVYRVPKEASPPASVAGNQTELPEVPEINYTIPPEWEKKPAGRMRVANFRIPGKDGQEAEASVLALPGTATDLEVINIFREQLSLPALSQPELTTQMEEAQIAEGQGKIFDMASPDLALDGKSRSRVLVASLARNNLTWFFRLSGENSLVNEQKIAFLQFLKSISFVAGPNRAVASGLRLPPETRTKEASPSGDKIPSFEVPSGWQEQPSPAMLLKSFLVTGKNGGKATITISVFPGNVGGPLLNVNRWRDQLSLPPIEEAELPKATRALDVMGGKAMLVELGGTDQKTRQRASMIAAMVSRDNSTWFYKLMGDDPVVAAEKDAFIKFVQTVRYPNA